MEKIIKELESYFKPQMSILEKQHLYRKNYNREICQCEDDKVYLANSGHTNCLHCSNLKTQYHPL